MERGAPHAKILYTVKEAAALLSLSRAHVYRLILGGRLETLRIGRSRRISAHQIERFVRSLEGDAAEKRAA